MATVNTVAGPIDTALLGFTLMRLTERYAEYGQVGFITFMRVDGNLLDAGSNPVKYYANSAT